MNTSAHNKHIVIIAERKRRGEDDLCSRVFVDRYGVAQLRECRLIAAGLSPFA